MIILTMDEITMMKFVTYSGKSTDNYHLTAVPLGFMG